MQSQRNDVMLGHYDYISIHLLTEPNGPNIIKEGTGTINFLKRSMWNEL